VKYRLPLVLLLISAVTVASVGPVMGQTADPSLAKRPPDDLTDPPPLFTFEQYPPSVNDNVVLQWDEELLQAVRALPPGPTVVARAISVVHTAIFDAWAAYDARALGTRLRASLRRPAAERTLANKNKAISFAAYRALVDLFPARQFDFAEQMSYLGYAVDGSDTSTPATVGNTAAQAVIDYRHGDGSNQLNGYADTTGYKPVNTGDVVVDPWRWQPLRVPLGTGPEQKATTPQWSKVKAFALKSPLPVHHPRPRPAAEQLRSQAHRQPARPDPEPHRPAEVHRRVLGRRSEVGVPARPLGADRPGPVPQAGHSLDTDAKLFFALGNALMDASIAAWAAKYKWDFVRPITGIRTRYKGKQVTSWLGPYKGYGPVDGSQWIPYQAPNVVTPPFPEYVSGHSTFSSAASAILAKFTGSDSFGASVTIEAGTSLFEPRTDTEVGTPATDVTLSWPTLTAAAKDAGLSRRLGGIHFQDGDEHGYNLGQRVGDNVLAQTMGYINGTITG
jgi:hypothetical protein